jgi:agmatine deiminase
VGFELRVPGEWEAQAGTWLCWPHHREHWGSKLNAIREFVEELVNTICRFQAVHLIVSDQSDSPPLSIVNKGSFPCHLHLIEHNDLWIRDYGPFFIKGSAQLEVRQFKFNAWGGKFPPWNLDQNVSKKIASITNAPFHESPLTLEGGAMEFNGSGIALSTRPCFISEHRNPNLSEDEMLSSVKKHLCLDDIVLLPDGLVGDHTDGHIDNLVRFISKDHILMPRPTEGDVNEQLLRTCHEQLKKWQHPREKWSLNISFLPSLIPIFTNDEACPRSYLNFIFLNDAILYPSYGEANQKEAQKALERLFPTRTIIAIDCSLLIQEGGALHCMTRQQPQ